jgi:cytochrome c-type biogenesis protein
VLADIVKTGLGAWWAPALAFAAGALSCASPCVWPLVPGYISFVSGGVARQERHPLVPILLFILGFTIVFALLGAFAKTFVRLFQGVTGQRIAGAVVVVMGVLMIVYALGRGSAALYAERRPFLQKVRPGMVGALPLGMAFAAGWTPCIGPVLGGIIAIAVSGSTARGVFLLVCYSLGLGLPFLLVGLGISWAAGAFDWVRRHYTPIAIASGTMLIAVGVLLATGTLTQWFVRLQRFAPRL